MISEEDTRIKDNTTQFLGTKERMSKQPPAKAARYVPQEAYLAKMIQLNTIERRNAFSIIERLQAPFDEGSADTVEELWG